MSHKIFGGIAMTNSQHANENLTIHHKVQDYATGGGGYNEHQERRFSAGIADGTGDASPANQRNLFWLLQRHQNASVIEQTCPALSPGSVRRNHQFLQIF